MRVTVRRPPLLAVLVALGIVIADQASKAVVLAFADRLPYTVAGGLRIELVRNTGVSFSLFTGSGFVIAGVAAVVVALLVLFLVLPRAYSMPLAVLLGGSLGNLIDRLHGDGSVVDFVAVYWWPRWNIADAAIVVGACLMVLTVVRRAPHAPRLDDGDGPQPPEG